MKQRLIPATMLNIAIELPDLRYVNSIPCKINLIIATSIISDQSMRAFNFRVVILFPSISVTTTGMLTYRFY